MNTPTPRTDAAWSSSFEPCEYRAAHTARTMRDECAKLERELATERDQLRAEVKSCGELSCDECNARTAALMAERDQLRAELANQTVRFHDEIVRRQGTVRANQELDLKELNHFRDLLATERARLDWFHEAASDRIWLVGQDIRAAIDAAMQEDAK